MVTRRSTDPWKVADAIRFGTATSFRPTTDTPTARWYTITANGGDTRFVGPTLYAAAEAARRHHDIEATTNAAPIYRLAAGTYTWWDTTTTDTNTDLAQRLPHYIAALLDVDAATITVTGPR